MQCDFPKVNASGKRKPRNFASISIDVGEGRYKHMFVMQHVTKIMTAKNPTKDDIC